MAINVRPLGDRVLVQPIEEKETKKGGIIIPDTAKEKPQEGKVVALGTGKVNEDGKKVEFELKDISGPTDEHMHHSVFTIIDANHHTEDWTFMMNDKPIHAHFDLHRTN